MIDNRQVALTKQLMAHFEAHGVSRRQFLRLLAAVGGGASLATLIAACGDDDDDGDDIAVEPTPADDDDAETPDTDDDDEPADTDAGGSGVLVFASGQDISNLDPHVGHDYSIASNQKSVYDTLLRYQGNPPEIENVLARDYEANEDASEWTVHLDDRAVFHDGTPVEASDVAYSVGRLIRKNRGPAWMFVAVMAEDAVEVIDTHTIVFHLETPFAPLPLILPWLFIVNEELVMEHDVDGDEGEAWLLEHEAGSGPFTITRWDVGDSYEFTAVPDYWWGWPAEGHLDGYVWRIIRESSSIRLALLNDDVQMAAGLEVGVEDFEALQQNPDFHVVEEPGLSVFAVKLNNQRGPCSDINVRKAISYAMDYEAVIEALRGHAQLLEGPLPNLGEYNNPNLNLYRHDMDLAQQHLEMSDYAGEEFELEYGWVTGLDIEEVIGLILIDKLGQLGIRVHSRAMVWPDLVARMSDEETAPDMSAVYSGTSYADPDNFLWQANHSSQAGFWAAASHYKNPEFDDILEQARATADHDERVQLYHRAQEILVDDAVEVWVQSEFSKTTWSRRVGGYRYTPIMGFYMQPLYLTD
jgi:peptide/nickel transport system substrate-binding protein